MNESPEWRHDGKRMTLLYLEYPLVQYEVEQDGCVRVATRAYSEGFVHSRVLATEQGARRYADAWMAKWGDQAMREVRNKVLAAAAAKRTGSPLDALGRPYPVIEVNNRPTRKRLR